jgi:uncharacterized protein YndB with AHSA1/START domain
MIDIDHEINAVRREVAGRVLDAGEARVVTITRRYAAPVEDVWSACTDPERIPRWFLPVSGELREGGRYQLEGNAGGTVERCDPPRSFTATWEFGGSVSWIELRLAPAGDGATRMALEHIAPVDDGGHWESFGPGAVGIGWDLGLMGLGRHLASGAPVDRDEVAAWSASDDGRRFIRESSLAWRDAAVASGADAAQAQAQAERTTAAYLGEPAPG